MNWWKNLKGKLRRREPLSRHTSFRIGGPADFFIEPRDLADLKSLLLLSKRYKIPLSIIGAGSNILVNDHGIDGIIVRLSSPVFKDISFKGNICEVGAGVSLACLLRASQEKDLSGLEFLAGIPGTLAGALAMNAGAQNKTISERVRQIKVMDKNGAIKTLTPKRAKFGYRTSGLYHYVILGARVELARKSKEDIKKQIEQYLVCRRLTQDYAYPSAGCVFKNPPGYCAGKLIDLCGLKGYKIGGASVSCKHANFILNKNRAKARDVMELINHIRKEVKRTFRVSLVPEIKIW